MSWVTIVEHVLGVATYAGMWLWGYQRGRRMEAREWMGQVK